MRFPDSRRAQLGFSLVEILVSLGIISLMSVMLSTVLVWTVQTASNFESFSQEERERLAAENTLRSVFLRAVDLRLYNPANPDLNTDTTGFGRVRPFDSDTTWATAPGTHTIAKFWREERRSERPGAPLPPNYGSAFRKTGVYFQKPTAGAPGKWGVLYIDIGADNSPLEPDPSDLTFEGLVRVRTRNIITSNNIGPVTGIDNRPVTSLDFEMTFRRFIVPPNNASYVFCPQAFVVANALNCSYSAPYRDVVRTVRLLTRNNILGVSPTLPNGAPVTGPTAGARTEDVIHFFKAAAPGDFL